MLTSLRNGGPVIQGLFEEIRRGLLASSQGQRSSVDQTYHFYLQMEDGQDITWQAQLKSALTQLTLKDVQILAATVFAGPYLDVRLHGDQKAVENDQSYNGLFKSMAEVRKALKTEKP